MLDFLSIVKILLVNLDIKSFKIKWTQHNLKISLTELRITFCQEKELREILLLSNKIKKENQDSLEMKKNNQDLRQTKRKIQEKIKQKELKSQNKIDHLDLNQLTSNKKLLFIYFLIKYYFKRYSFVKSLFILYKN